jgi:hypothetical protein
MPSECDCFRLPNEIELGLTIHLTAEDMADLNHLASKVSGDRYLPAMANLAER